MLALHRIFGLALTDYFTDSPYRVDTEKDLSVKQQYLDVVIIEQEAGRPMPELPDGLDNIGQHNLATYKSSHQALDSWGLDELLGHFVNYRKQISPSLEKLLPVEDFRLYAVCTREPEKLATEVTLTPLKPGVYETLWGTHKIRIIVLSQMPKTKRNAIWHLFSGIAEKVQYGVENYQWRRSDNSTIINQLYHHYRVEGIAMSYTFQDYYRDFTKENLGLLTAEERLEGLPVEERLKGLPVEERLKGLPPRLLLQSLSADEIEAYLKKLRKKKTKRK